MATAKQLSQIEVHDLTADNGQTYEKEEEPQFSMNYISYKNDELNNTSPRHKFGELTSRVCTMVRSKFKNHRCCLWSSRAVVLILVWNLIISTGFKSFFDPSLYAVMFNDRFRM